MHACQLRPAVAADAGFLYDVSEIRSRRYVEAMWRKWAAARMREKCEHDARDPWTRIVVIDGVDAGVFSVESRADEHWLHRMYLLPPFQRRGIGRQWVIQVQDIARAAGLPVRQQVMRANPGRACFYGPLGPCRL